MAKRRKLTYRRMGKDVARSNYEEEELTPERLEELKKIRPTAADKERSEAKMRELGRRLRTAREALNYNLETVALMAGITVTELEFIEANAGDARIDVILSVMEAVKLEMNELFEGL